MGLKRAFRRLINRAGFELYRFPTNGNAAHARQRMFEHLGINLVLDVGAHVGQYAHEIYDGGFRGRCISFEPVAAVFRQLSSNPPAKEWSGRNFALGAANEETDIHINYTMSSILSRAQDTGDFAINDSRTERITVRRLDDVGSDLMTPADITWLKLDVQGYELKVLEGAARTLPTLAAVEAELSIKPFYAGQPPYRALIDHLDAAGFDLWSIIPGVREAKSGRMLEMDGIFVNRSHSSQG